MDFDKVWKLYSNCIPVSGANRASICDLQLNRVILIPMDLYNILIDNSTLNLRKIVTQYGINNEDIIKEYLHYLYDNEVLFEFENCTEEEFPLLDLDFLSPEEISNAIIEVSLFTIENIVLIIEQLNKLGCKFVELRNLNEVSNDQLDYILRLLNESNCRSISLMSKYDIFLNGEDLVRKYLKLVLVVLFESEENIVLDSGIICVKEKLDNSCCGKISPNYFSINIPTFTEAQNYNTCLNKKITIDRDGNLKNCPSLPDIYGNIQTVSIEEVIKDPIFKKKWNINKNQIEVCKDCEFRYICTDCRAYLKENDNIYSKPLKCSYDPYTATWGENNSTINQLYGK